MAVTVWPKISHHYSPLKDCWETVSVCPCFTQKKGSLGRVHQWALQSVTLLREIIFFRAAVMQRTLLNNVPAVKRNAETCNVVVSECRRAKFSKKL